jgi:DNA-binding response OmpR family regulator
LWILSKRRSTKQNKIIFSEDTLVYKGERIDLDAKAAQLLRLFIQSGGTVTASEAMRLVENPRFSEGHNLKIKNHLIDTLNLTLKTLLKSNSDPIKAVRSADDRRNKSYRLDVSRFVLKS